MMSIKIVYVFVLPLYIVYIMYSSIRLGTTPNEMLLFASGVLLLTSVFMEQKLSPRVYYPQLMLFLGIFHWYSHLNWCQTIYFVLSINPIYQAKSVQRSILITSLFALQYTIIRLTYIPQLNQYDFLVSFTDYLTSIVLVLIIRYIVKTEMEKRILRAENHHLSSHDPLTGLLTFQEYTAQIDKLMAAGKPLVHVLIDCRNFKAMNHTQGVQVGNETLKKIAEYLDATFPKAELISRFDGDAFALALSRSDETIPYFANIFHSELPQRLDIEMSFSFSIYPDEAASRDELFTLAESRLFREKRELWLKQEEDVFRSEKLRAIGELAAGMAHEIRNPLTTIKGFLQLAKRNDYNIEPWYDLLQNEVLRMTELTYEFLDFSKPHINNMKAHVLNDCVQRVIHLTESQAALLGHQMEYTPSAGPLYVFMDKEKIVQVLLNIAKNGLEAMSESGVLRIQISVEGDHAVTEIQDSGRGIPEGEKAQIFQPFYTTKATGTGLGLSICHKIVQDHNGRIEVKSKAGKGATFRIILPLHRE